MGYMGLDCPGDSDVAAGLAIDVIESMIKSLKKGFKIRENSYNTDGPVNVGLILEEFVDVDFCGNEELAKYAVEEFIPAFEKYISKYEDDIKKDIKSGELYDKKAIDNAKWHLKSFKRILKNVKGYEDIYIG